MPPVIIIGTGLGGFGTARELRRLGDRQPLILITEEEGHSYSKPMLSSAWTQGNGPDDLVMANAAEMRTRLDAEILAGTTVTAIDTNAHTVTAGGERLQYSKLVLALGAVPIRIPVQGDAGATVISINNLSDFERYRQLIDDRRRLTIMGAGLIGCEFANDARHADKEVRVIDLAPHPLGRLVPPEAGTALREALAEIGVAWHFETTLARVDRSGDALRATLGDGSEHDTDVVLSAVGLRPNTTLAEQAGLRVERGIVTGRSLQTSAEDVYALGDCAEVEGLVLPFVMPVMHASKALAKTLAGEPTDVHYPAMPVVVKTSHYPVIVAPPAPGAEGEWMINRIEGGLHCEFRDRGGKLLGFTLTGSAVREKQALASQLAPVL